MTSVVLIGNGLSRDNIELDGLRQYGHVIGCNFIYRGGQPGDPPAHAPFLPDTLVSIDSPPQDDVRVLYGFKPPFDFLTQNVRRTHALLNREVLCEKPNAVAWNNSGVFGLWYACEWLKATRVHLVGVDFFRPVKGRVGVKGYETNDTYGIYTIGVSVHRCFRSIAEMYPKTEMIRVGPVADDDIDFYAEHVATWATLKGTI